MEVLIDNRQKKYPMAMTKIQQKARDILNVLECHDAELSVLIVDDPQIATLNQKYLHRSGPTNVIAFPMHTDVFPNINPGLLGDVVISIETAAREGERIGIGMEERVVQLLVHGILHLIGYDHEKSEAQTEQMAQIESEVLRMIQP
ncbi:MAG: rRNA maturation RNase YbeY [Desulfobacterales bacterium]|jgi:probable rRNA maturation factor|nr:rRNA maturation RNase YbeY [Desulfobacterales bacterium]